MAKMTKPDADQRKIIARRGLDPGNYMVVKSTHGCLWLYDLRYKKITVINKFGRS